MYKNFLIACAIVVVTGAGLYGTSVSALTTDDVQAQIQRLMAQITELTAQITRLRAQVNTSLPNVNASPVAFQHRICNILNRNLAQGAEGDDVRGLQEYLYENKFLAVAPTGYFGPMTAQAVAKWQSREGVSAIGSFGPMSRERIKIWCGGGNNANFRASPQRGPTPLVVTFYTKSGFSSATDYHMIDFGDGQSERVSNCPPQADSCNRNNQPGTNTHTYTADGSYTASLLHIIDLCGGVNTTAGGPACMAPISQEIVGKVQINVGSIACTKEYKPVCGSKPIVCITTPCNPIPTTYGNRCEMNADGANFLYEGQCKTSYKNPGDDPMCKAWNDGIPCGGQSCSRDVAGGTPSCSSNNCYPTTPQVTSWRCTAHFDNFGNKPPVISGFSGPTTLEVNATGTWTISASDPENQQLSYKITWGDERTPYTYPQATAMSAEPVFVQNTTFTHSYASAGNYIVTMLVQDSSGQSAKTSTTVKVGYAVTCTGEYAPVCGQPAWSCPNGMYCATVMPAPKTFSNRCMMNAAGASLLYEGQCANGY